MTIFRIVLSVLYFLPGAAKLAGVKPIREQFDEFGLGRNAMLAIGGLEVAAAVGLWIDGLDVLAAVGMVAMMIGGVVYHRRVGHEMKDSVPALVIMIASLLYALISL